MLPMLLETIRCVLAPEAEGSDVVPPDPDDPSFPEIDFPLAL